MATHTHLPIYKVAYDLLDVVTGLVKNMQRDFKRSIGEKISTECIEITVLIFRANVAQDKIEAFLSEKLSAKLNPKKTILQPVDRGIDFAGQVIKPWRRTLRRRTFNEAIARTRKQPATDLFETANSYFGLLRQTTNSHHDRTRLANTLRQRGHSVKADLTKTYRKSA